MSDRIHQPYRAPICPLLPLLLPLVGLHGILGAALSGAGPAVLVVVDDETHLERASAAIQSLTQGRLAVELMNCRFSSAGASQLIEIKTS
jgi:homoserine kinase